MSSNVRPRTRRVKRFESCKMKYDESVYSDWKRSFLPVIESHMFDNRVAKVIIVNKDGSVVQYRAAK